MDIDEQDLMNDHEEEKSLSSAILSLQSLKKRCLSSKRKQANDTITPKKLYSESVNESRFRSATLLFDSQ